MASNWEVARHAGPRLPYVFVPMAKSKTYAAGDLIVLSTYSSITANSQPVGRPILDADETASLQDGSGNTCGVLGIADFGGVTNSSGVASSQNNFSGKAAAAEPIFSAPSQATTLPADPLNGFSQLRVIEATDAVEFYAPLISTAADATAALKNTLASIDVDASNVATIDPSGSPKDCIITDIDPNDVRRVMVKVLPAYQQSRTGFNYTAQ